MPSLKPSASRGARFGRRVAGREPWGVEHGDAETQELSPVHANL